VDRIDSKSHFLIGGTACPNVDAGKRDADGHINLGTFEDGALL